MKKKHERTIIKIELVWLKSANNIGSIIWIKIKKLI